MLKTGISERKLAKFELGKPLEGLKESGKEVQEKINELKKAQDTKVGNKEAMKK